MTSTTIPRHKRNNSMGSVSTSGWCSFSSFDFAGPSGADNFSVDAGDSIVSEFEKMVGVGGGRGGKTHAECTDDKVARNESSNSDEANGVESSVLDAALVMPSPSNSGKPPLRRRLGAVDTLAASSPDVRALNLPCTPGSYSSGTTKTPSRIGDIIVGTATSPGSHSIGSSTIGSGLTSATPISRTAMRDLLDTLNSLEDDSCFGESVGQSTISTKTSTTGNYYFRPQAQHKSPATKSKPLPPSSTNTNNRPPRALNIPARTTGQTMTGIPHPFTGNGGRNNKSIPSVPLPRPSAAGGYGNKSQNRSFTSNGSKSKASTARSNNARGGSELKIPAFADEIDGERQTMTKHRAQPQSVLEVKDERSRLSLPPMHQGTNKTDARSSSQTKAPRNMQQVKPSRTTNGAFPIFSVDENTAPTPTPTPTNNKSQPGTTKSMAMPRSRVMATKTYKAQLPSINNQKGRYGGFDSGGAKCAGSTVGHRRGAHPVLGDRNSNIVNTLNLAEF